MPLTSLQCPTPIRRRPSIAPRDYSRRDRAIESFEAGQFHESVQETFGYLLPAAAVPDLAGEAFHFVQGSARVYARIEDGSLCVTTTLAALEPEAQSTAALRFFLTRISATGQMFQPRLRDGVIALEFHDQLSLLHPLKLIEVLTKLPMEADRNDAWMIEQFGVATPDREPIAPLDAAEFERALAMWNTHWAAMDELMAHSRRRRSVRFLGALGAYAVNQVRYTLPLFGGVRARLNEGAEDFTDGDEDPNKREGALVKCIKAMRHVSADELRQCLGHATYAINPLHDGGPSLLTSMLGGSERMQGIDELRAAGHALEAAVELFAVYLSLLAHHSWPDDVAAALRAGLDLASAKPWREAAQLLADHAHTIARTFGSHGARDQDDETDEFTA